MIPSRHVSSDLMKIKNERAALEADMFGDDLKETKISPRKMGANSQSLKDK